MDELNQGFQNDLSKTFDNDETFDKVQHTCKAHPVRKEQWMSIGTKCPHCGEIVRKEG